MNLFIYEMILNPILPLIVDYLDNPFELIKTSKSTSINAKKYKLTLKTDKTLDDNIFQKYKFRKLIITSIITLIITLIINIKLKIILYKNMFYTILA